MCYNERKISISCHTFTDSTQPAVYVKRTEESVKFLYIDMFDDFLCLREIRATKGVDL